MHLILKRRPKTEGDKIEYKSIKTKAMLTFSAFFAASAPDRLSKVTNPTGWKV